MRGFRIKTYIFNTPKLYVGNLGWQQFNVNCLSALLDNSLLLVSSFLPAVLIVSSKLLVSLTIFTVFLLQNTTILVLNYGVIKNKPSSNEIII